MTLRDVDRRSWHAEDLAAWDADLRALTDGLGWLFNRPVDLPLSGADTARGAQRCDDVLRAGEHRWERRAAGSGSKGKRTCDWALHAITVKDQSPVDGFQLGPDHYLVRTWTPWHRHVTLAMLAAAFFAVNRAKLGKDQSFRESEIVR